MIKAALNWAWVLEFVFVTPVSYPAGLWFFCWFSETELFSECRS